MFRRVSGRLAALLLPLLIVAGCARDSTTPAAPAAPAAPSATRAAIAVTSISVAGERALGGGYVYRVVLHLRESAGVAGRLDAVDFTFAKGSDVIMSSRHDQLMSAGGNTVPANGTADTRELVTTDSNAAHAYASTVSAQITFTDSTGAQSTVASASVPALSDPLPTTHTLTGVISDQTTGGGIDGARVEALNGVNAGRATTTDRTGSYTLSGLAADTFRMRAAVEGYEWGEQNVTVPNMARADMTLRRPAPAPPAPPAPSAPCAFSVAATSGVDGKGQLAMSWQGGQSSLTITRTSGTCGWQASADVNWISLANPSGNGSGTLAFTVGGNGFNSRTGVITVEWTGGRAQMTVFQGTPPDTCVLTLTVGGQSTIAVPQAGGQFTAYLLPAPGVPPMACDGVWNASASSSAIAFIGSTTGINGNGTVTFTVAPNGTSAARTLFVSVSGSGSATLRLNQSP